MKNFSNNLIMLVILSTPSFSTSYGNHSDSSVFFSSTAPEDIIVKIASFIDDANIGHLSQVNKHIHGLLSKESIQGGRELRGASNFGVTDSDGNKYFLKEYMSQRFDVSIIKVNNISELIKHKPNDFIDLFFRENPTFSKTIRENLIKFLKIIQIDEVIAELPNYENPQKKLATLILFLYIWKGLDSSFETQISIELLAQVSGKSRSQLYLRSSEQVDLLNLNIAQLWSPIENAVQIHRSSHVFRSIRGQIRSHFIEDIIEQIGVQSYIKIRKQKIFSDIFYQVNNDLEVFDFSRSFGEGRRDHLIKLASDYHLMANLMGIVAFSHSEEMNLLIKNLSQYISFIMPEIEAIDIIDSIELPEVNLENPIVQVQLDILRKYLN